MGVIAMGSASDARMDGSRQCVRASLWTKPAWLVASMLLLTLLVRLVATAVVPLIPEEAYYWMYAQHPSWSYFDHPPMVAWVVRLGTETIGNNEFGVRFVGSLLVISTIAMVYAFSRFWVSRKASCVAAATLLVLPVYVWTGFINTMDSQLIFFWVFSLFGASVALRSERRAAWLGWYIAGVGLGGAMLSKYTGIFVGAGIGLALFSYRPWWKHLRSPHVYLGALTGVAMFAPVVLWNYRNDWASFRFQFLDRAEAHPLKSWMTIRSTVVFLLLQVADVSPLLFALWMQTFRGRRSKWFARLHRQPLVMFSIATALPLLAAIAWKSVLFDVHFDWTAPGYLALLPLIGQTLAARWRLNRSDRSGFSAVQSRQAKVWDWSAVWTLIICVAGNTGCLLYLIFVTPHTGHPDEFGPWRSLAAVVETYENKLEAQTGKEPLIIGRGKYRLASELAFYRSGLEREASSKFTTSQWFFGDVEGLGFAYWLRRPDWIGRDCIYVSDKDDIGTVVGNRFKAIELISDPALHLMSGGITYHLAICHGFRG